MQNEQAPREPDIRIASTEEMGLVFALVEELLEELGPEAADLADLDRERLLATLKLAPKNDPRFLALLARDENGDPVGVLTLSSAFAIYAGGEYGIIQEMYVRPGRRDRGLGERLLDAATEIAGERGWRRLDVTGPTAAAVDPSAARAVRFYERHGFEHSGPKLRLLLGEPSVGETGVDRGGDSRG